MAHFTHDLIKPHDLRVITELTEKLQQYETDLFSGDQAAMNLKSEVLDLNEKYKGTQQKHVLERFVICKPDLFRP